MQAFSTRQSLLFQSGHETVDKFAKEVICCRVSKLDLSQIEQWRDLYLNSISPNIYMSPDFVLTALQTFCSEDPVIVGIASGDQLMGLGILQECTRSPKFPLQSMQLFNTIQSFQSGILLRSDISDSTVDAFLYELIAQGNTNILFTDFAMTTASAAKLIASARRQNFRWHDSRSYSRPTLDSKISLDDWKAGRKKMIKETDRLRRRLTEQGPLTWKILMPDEISEKTVETFLSLEHDGWKGDESTSLLSRDQDAAFFRQLIPKLISAGEIFFTELRLNNDTIASTVNFMSGDVAFAYKVAWSKQFARFGPGILNEISFIEYAASNELPFSYIESGTTGNSFIERLWPGRVSMFTGYLIGGRINRSAAMALCLGSQLRRALSRVRLLWKHQ